MSTAHCAALHQRLRNSSSANLSRNENKTHQFNSTNSIQSDATRDGGIECDGTAAIVGEIGGALNRNRMQRIVDRHAERTRRRRVIVARVARVVDVERRAERKRRTTYSAFEGNGRTKQSNRSICNSNMIVRSRACSLNLQDPTAATRRATHSCPTLARWSTRRHRTRRRRSAQRYRSDKSTAGQKEDSGEREKKRSICCQTKANSTAKKRMKVYERKLNVTNDDVKFANCRATTRIDCRVANQIVSNCDCNDYAILFSFKTWRDFSPGKTLPVGKPNNIHRQNKNF